MFSGITQEDKVNLEQELGGALIQDYVPLNASSTVADADSGNVFDVPLIFDETDTRFAIDTQVNQANKSNYVGKTFVGEDLTPDETITSIKKNDNNWIENTYKGAAISGIKMYNTFRAFAESSGAAEIKQYTENQYNPSFIDKLTGYQDTKTMVAKYGENAIINPQEEIDRKTQLSVDIMKKSTQFIKDSGLEAEGVMADIGGATVSIGASIGLTYATGNPVAAAALFGASARASAYLEARENGKSDLEAMSVANAVGIGEGALEFLGIEKLFKVAKNSVPVARGINKIALNAVKKFGSGFAVEAIQESSQGLSEEVLMQNFGGRDKEIYQTAKDIAYQGLIGGLLGGASSAVIGTIENQLGKTVSENITEEEFKNISKDTITELYQSDIGDEIINVLGKELDPSTDAYTPEEFSREVKRIDGEKRQTIIDNLIAKNYTPEQANEALDTAINKVTKINSITQVEIDVANKLKQAGYSVDEANKQAKVFGANAFKMGNILGIDPYTYYKEHSNFEIVKGEKIKEGDLGQDLTPQQKEFFKDTKVVDDKGEPLVVYHGTSADFDTFQKSKIGSRTDSGYYGSGFYFTESKGEAEYYGNKTVKAYLSIKNPLVITDYMGGYYSGLENNLFEKGGLFLRKMGLLSKEDDAKLSKYIEIKNNFIKNVTYEETLAYDAGHNTINSIRAVINKNGKELWELPYDTQRYSGVQPELNTKEKAINRLWSEYNFIDRNEDLIKDFSISDYVRENDLSSEITKKAKEMGYDGIVAGDEIIAFSPNQIKEVSNVAPTADPNIYKQDKRGFIRENETGTGYIIGLLDADLSTFLHEGFGHLFTLELKKAGIKSPVAKKKWDTLADYYGYDENGTAQEKEDALERMGRAFEAYFMEGKSPNKRLASAFETFKQWLVEIYKSFSSLRTYINPEVKAVFDTLVGGKSIDEVFTDEGTKLYSELNAIKERKFEKLFSGQISANEIVENKGLISGVISRIKQLSDGIKDLATKDKEPVVAIANEFGAVRLNDIETAIKMSHMRIPAETKKLINILRRKTIKTIVGYDNNKLDEKGNPKPIIEKRHIGGINAEWANRFGLIDIQKDYDKTVFVKEGGIANENNLADVLRDNGFMFGQVEDTRDSDREFDEIHRLIENMDNVSTDFNKSQAREIALDAKNSADEYIGKIFPNKSEAEILEMIDDYKSKNNLYDKISKGAAKDIKSLMNEIDSNIKSLSRAIKKENMQEAKDIKEIIIDLISDLPKAQRSDFIYKIKNINTAKQLTKELPEIVDKIREILESNFTKRIDKKIKSILRNSIPKKINGRLKSRFDNSEIQDVMNNANKIINTDAAILEKELSEFDFDKIVTAEEAFDNMLKDVALGTASPETYIDVYNSLRDIYENGKIAGEAARILRTENNKRLIKGTEEVIKMSKGKVVLSKLNNMLKSFVGWDDALDFLSGGDKTSKLGESFISKEFDVFKEELKERKTANDWLFTLEEKIKEALGVKDSRKVSKYIDELGKVYDLGEFQFLKKDATGEYITKNVTMTKDQMIDFYMKMKDKVAYKSIIDEQGNAFSEDLIKTIESHLTAEDIKVAEAIFEFYLNTRDEVFEYNRVQTGISLKSRENYSPRYRDMGKEIVATVASIKQSLAGSGRFKEATEVVAPIKFAGAFNTVNKYIMEVSNYMAWQNKLRDLNVVFSNKEVFDYIEDIFGKGMNKLISEKIQGFADRGKVYSNLSEDFVNKLRANYTTAVLSINPSLWFKQMTAFVAYADEIPTVDFIAGVADFLANPNKAIKSLSDSTFVKNRAKDFTLEVKEINESTPVRNFLANKNFRNLMMLPTSLGDKSSIFLGGYPVYRYWIKQGLSHEQAIEKFERASNSTQQSSYLSQLSSWQGNNLGKLFAMFTSAPNQYFRKEYSAIRGLITGRMPYDQVIKRIAIYHFILPMFFQLIANLGRWDDKDEARAAMLGSFNGLFIIGDAIEFLISKAQGDFAFPNNIPFIKEFESTAKALVDIAKSLDDIGSEDFFDAIKDLTASAGNLSGLPVEKLYNIWEGAMDIMDGEYIYGTEKLLGWTPWVVKNQEGGLPKIIAEEMD